MQEGQQTYNGIPYSKTLFPADGTDHEVRAMEEAWFAYSDASFQRIEALYGTFNLANGSLKSVLSSYGRNRVTLIAGLHTSDRLWRGGFAIETETQSGEQTSLFLDRCLTEEQFEVPIILPGPFINIVRLGGYRPIDSVKFELRKAELNGKRCVVYQAGILHRQLSLIEVMYGCVEEI